MHQHKADLSCKKLSALLILLGLIWILCYTAEQQFPKRHIDDTYDRIGSRQVNSQSLQFAKNLLQLTDTVNIEDQRLRQIETVYGVKKQDEIGICVILLHGNSSQTQSMTSIKSLLSQKYSRYRIFYFNNYAMGQQVYKYIADNALDKQLIKLIDDIPNSNYVKQYDYARNYCNRDQIVIYMRDEDVLVGYNVFNIVNGFFGKYGQLRLLYTASLVGVVDQKGNVQYQLGRSYQYPQDVVQNTTYHNYPYLMGGLKAFKGSVFTQLKNQTLLNKSNQPYKKAGDVAFGISLLHQAKKNVKYLPQPLVLRKCKNQYITYDKQLNDQLIEISKKY